MFQKHYQRIPVSSNPTFNAVPENWNQLYCPYQHHIITVKSKVRRGLLDKAVFINECWADVRYHAKTLGTPVDDLSSCDF